MVIALYLVRPFLTSGPLDTSAKVCVYAFAIAIPFLAGLLMVSYQESFRHRSSRSPAVNVARMIAQLAAFVGIVAGFWHIHWVVGVVFVTATLVAVGVHSAAYVRLEFDQVTD